MHIQESPYQIVGLMRIQVMTDPAGASILQAADEGLFCFMEIGQWKVRRQSFGIPALVAHHAAVHATITGVGHLHDGGMATATGKATVSRSHILGLVDVQHV